ncbi:ABC transporter substrate-binding protein [Bradyrhizobium sp. AZCC 2230]|uniref:ABC transporter substrate-binding protein n=1 Tax=Bradyrhizobium sp. AZCC 2230 TaxID=3117021 RepID=UPI002FF33526
MTRFMNMDRRQFAFATFALAASARWPANAAARDTVRMGQATTTLGFLPVWAARAYDTFAAEQVELNWAAINGGDPACLAALDSGDIDIAATGSDSVLEAVAKGQPYQIIYSLMSKISLNLTVSEAMIKRTGISRSMPIKERIACLKGATIGVAVVGGAQDRTVRWLATRGGLDGRKDVQVVQIGSAAALGAALENGRIDAFMLSPPEGPLAEAAGYGRTVIEPDTDIAGWKGMPSLVLVGRSDANETAQKKIVATLRAMNSANHAVLSDLEGSADKIGGKFFPKLPQPVMRVSIKTLADGIRDDGLLNDERAKLLSQFVEDSGRTPPAPGSFWTNKYVELAKTTK